MGIPPGSYLFHPFTVTVGNVNPPGEPHHAVHHGDLSVVPVVDTVRETGKTHFHESTDIHTRRTQLTQIFTG